MRSALFGHLAVDEITSGRRPRRRKPCPRSFEVAGIDEPRELGRGMERKEKTHWLTVKKGYLDCLDSTALYPRFGSISLKFCFLRTRNEVHIFSVLGNAYLVIGNV